MQSHNNLLSFKELGGGPVSLSLLRRIKGLIDIQGSVHRSFNKLPGLGAALEDEGEKEKMLSSYAGSSHLNKE